jgi:plastocyanin
MKRITRAGTVAGLFVLAIVLGACSSAAANNSTPPANTDPDAIQITAMDLRFSTATISAAANKPFQIAFDNHDGAPHNVAIYDGSFSTKVFGEDPFGGPKQVVYSVKALAPGTYGFRCDVHPDMKGTLTVK